MVLKGIVLLLYILSIIISIKLILENRDPAKTLVMDIDFYVITRHGFNYLCYTWAKY